MSTDDPTPPWTTLAALAKSGDMERLAAFVGSLSAADAARTLAHLSGERQHDVLTGLEAEDAARLLEQLSRGQVADLMDHLDAEETAEILAELAPALEADIVRDMNATDAALVLEALAPDDAETVRRLAAYDDDVAGGLMSVQFVTVETGWTLAEAVERLRADAGRFRDAQVQYLYVTAADGQLRGVLRLRDLVLAPPDGMVADWMAKGAPVTVAARATLLELATTFDGVPFVALPVVDDDRLVGVVTRAAVMEAVGDEAARDHLLASGIVEGDELRSMPVLTRARRRLQWLSVNVGLNIVAAGVIAAFTDTIAAVIALAVFLPIISDMSGCSGNQAVAVSMRELSLGVARPADALYVLRKELSVGVLNGLGVGLLLGLAAFAWQGNAWLGLVVGGALGINTVLAVAIGGTVPLVLEGAGVDPALASGPLLTTVTDLCGFLLVLGMATAMLPWIV